MALTERLQILVTADAKGAAAEFKRIGATAERELGKTDDRLKRMSAQLTSFGVQAGVAGGLATAGVFKLAQAAGDYGEAASSAGVIFGESAKEIEAFGQTAIDTAGVSRRAAVEAANTFGTFGKAAGLTGDDLAEFSTDLTQLAGDLASFKNTSTEDAITALGAALRGESEPLRRYGVLLDDATLKAKATELGIYSGNAALTAQQKILAADAVIFEQTSDAQGDFARTSDSLSNQTRIASAQFENLKIAVGQGAVPVFSELLGATNGALGAFQKLDPATQGVVGRLATFAALGATAAGGMALLAGGILRGKDALTEFTTRARAADGVSGRLARSGVLMGKALGGAGAALAVWQLADALNQGTRNATEFETAVLRIKNAAPGADIGQNLKDAAQEMEGLGDQIYDALGRIVQQEAPPTVSFGEFTEEIDNLERALAGMKATNPDELARSLAYLEDNLEFEDDGTIRSRLAFEDFLNTLESYREWLKETGKAERDAGGSADDLRDRLGDLGGETDEAKEATEALDASLRQLNRAQALATFGFDSAAAAAEGYADAIERSTNADDILSAALGAGRALKDLRDGFDVEADETERATEETDYLSEALERLSKAADRSDPKLTVLGRRLGELAAASDAFSESIANSTAFDDQVASALDLGSAFKDFTKVARRLPADIDIVALTTGKYTRRQREAIGATLDAGRAAQDYLSTLIRTGASHDKVRGEAARLREEYEAQLRQLGLNEEQIRKYIELMGLAPDQINTAITVSGAEAARFKVNAYLQLLEGRIPAEVATRVTTLLENDDLEGAARALADFAATNPAEIPVEPTVDEKTVEVAKAKLQPLFEFDFASAALGKYTEEQMAFLDAVLAFGDASTDYIAQLAAIKDGQDDARVAAVELREALEQELSAQGIPQETIDKLVELAGLSDQQIDFAITMSGFEETAFKINTLLGLFDGDFSTEQKLRIKAAMDTGDYDAALAVINGEIDALERDPVEVSVKLTPKDWEGVPNWLGGAMADPNHAVWKVGVDADPSQATDVMVRWRNEQTGEMVIKPVGANPGPAFVEVERFGAVIGRQRHDTNVGADLGPARRAVDAFQPPDKRMKVYVDLFGGQGFGATPGMDWNLPGSTPWGPNKDPWKKRNPYNTGQGGLDGNPFTPFSDGGLVGAPDAETLRKFEAIGSDTVPAMLTPGEYVSPVDVVRRESVAAFDMLRDGDATIMPINGTRFEAAATFPGIGIPERRPREPQGPLGPGEMSEAEFARRYPTLYAAIRDSGAFVGGKTNTLSGGFRASDFSPQSAPRRSEPDVASAVRDALSSVKGDGQLFRDLIINEQTRPRETAIETVTRLSTRASTKASARLAAAVG